MYRAEHPHGLSLSRGIDEFAWMLGSGVVLLYTLGNFLIRPYAVLYWPVFLGLVLAATLYSFV